MVALYTLLLGVISVAACPELHQGYLIPKLDCLAGSGVIISILLIARKRLWLPRLDLWSGGALLCCALSCMRSTGINGVVWAGGLGLFLAAVQLPECSVGRLKSGIFWVATLQAVLVFTQILAPGSWSALNIGFVPSRSSGLVGNREFMATLIGLGILLRFPSWSKLKECRSVGLKSAAFLQVAALLVVASKGTVLLIALAWSAPVWLRAPRRFAWFVPILIGTVSLLSESVRARVAIWMAAGEVAVRSLPFGVGEGGFRHGYVSALEQSFRLFPGLRSKLGDLSGVPDDPHNFVLQMAIEAGVLGLIAAGLWAAGFVKHLLDPEGDEKRGAFLLIFAKLLYTVVLASPLSMAAGALALGTVYPRANLTARPVYAGRVIIACLCLVAGASALHAASVSQSEFLYSRGLKELRLNRLVQAQETFDRLARFDQSRADSWLGSAWVAVAGHPARDPEPYLQKAIALDPGFNTLKIAAKTYLVSGDCYHASELYRRIHLAFPEHLSSLTGLATCAQAMNDPVSAREYARLLLATQPRVPTSTYGLNLLTAAAILEKTR